MRIPSGAYRLFGLVKNSFLAGQVTVRSLSDDPVLFALQVSRRLPFAVSKKLGACLAGLPGTVVAFVPVTRSARLARSWSGLQNRVAAELALGAGGLDWRDESLPLKTRARAAWDLGSVDEAVRLAEQAGASGYVSRLRGEALLLDPEFRLELGVKLAGNPADLQQGISVLHLLTNSTPATQSGYTLRSQRLLQALIERNISIQAYTRVGYPVMIGNLNAAGQVHDGRVVYHRVLPLVLGGTQPKRLVQWGKGVLKNLKHKNLPQVVHTTTNYPNGLVAQAVAEVLNVPWVYEARGLMEETWVSNKKTKQAQDRAEQSQRFILTRNRETKLMQQADHVVTLSETMKSLFVDRGISPQKITVIPNAVDEKLFEQNLTSAQARTQINLPQQGFWVGSVSSLVDYEGFDTLLQAVAQLRRKGLDVRVLLVGDGVARGALEKLASSLAQDPQVGEFAVFTGKIRPEMAYVAHQALDVFAVPRRNNRVCRSVTPLKPIEAMALGRPVVVSDLPPLTELVQNGITGPTGLLAEAENPESFAQAFEKLMHHDGTRTACAREGRMFARTRTWAENAGKLENLYRKLIENFASE